MIETKVLRLGRVREDADAGTIVGAGPLFDVVSEGHVLQKGALDKTLAEHEWFPVFEANNRREPIGRAAVMAQADAIGVGVKLDLDTQGGRDAAAFLPDGVLGVALNYRPIKTRDDVRDGSPVRVLTEVALRSISVTFPGDER
jgi:HK97 family phage prohead protease